MQILAALALLVSVCYPQSASQIAHKADLERLSDLAGALPPELAADALIRLSMLPGAVDTRWRVERLERAFDLASYARFPVDITATAEDVDLTDTDAGVRRVALAGFSTLALQCRAVSSMLPLDRSKARRLFERIPILRPPALSCKTPLVPAVDEYYRLLQRILENGYTPDEQKKGKQIEALEMQLMLISSPVQLQPAAGLLTALSFPKEDLPRLIVALTTAIKQMSADDRTFTSIAPRRLAQTLFDMAARFQKEGTPSVALLEAYRSFLVRQLRGSRCADSTNEEGEGASVANTIEQFNISLHGSPFQFRAISPIREEEAKPTHVIAEEPEIYHFWSKPSAKRLLDGVEKLRAVAPEQRKESEWETRVRDFLKDLEGWKKDDDELESNYFHQACPLYRALIEVSPPGTPRQTVVESHLAFLRQSPVARENPPEWLMEFRLFLSVGDAGHTQIREGVRRSGDAAMIVYSELERSR